MGVSIITAALSAAGQIKSNNPHPGLFACISYLPTPRFTDGATNPPIPFQALPGDGCLCPEVVRDGLTTSPSLPFRVFRTIPSPVLAAHIRARTGGARDRKSGVEGKRG